MRKYLAIFVALLSLFWASSAFAQVTMSFHSFNGSVFWGRYPHAFIVFEGTLESNGEPVDSNYGFSATAATPAVLMGPVKHEIMVEEEKWIKRTNRHFTIDISDEKYWEIMEEIARWRDHPGNYYDLNKRNCIHFVGRMGEIAGLRVDFPKKLTKKPRSWLNYIAAQNPELGAEPITK